MFKYPSVTLLFILTAGHIASADLLRVPGGTSLPRDLGPAITLESRQSSCPTTCTADDGDSVCMALADVCCQNSGHNPFSCPVDYPYCCDDQLCGNSATCAGPVVNDGGSSTSASPSSPTSTPKKSLGNHRTERDEGVRSGLFAAIIAIGATLF